MAPYFSVISLSSTEGCHEACRTRRATIFSACVDISALLLISCWSLINKLLSDKRNPLDTSFFQDFLAAWSIVLYSCISCPVFYQMTLPVRL